LPAYGRPGDAGLDLFSAEDHEIKPGERVMVAQLLIQPIETAVIEEVQELSESNRGENAFGSTGVR